MRLRRRRIDVLKVGDVVIVLRVHPRSSAFRIGLREGHVGTVIRSGPCPCGDSDCPIDTDVRFIVGVGGCWSQWLRKIDPPEAGRWEDCAWQPQKTSA